MSDVTLHLGFDDIDSPTGGCTTHFISLLVEDLDRRNARWIDYPGLIRLNPGIPYRTRGNGAVVLRFSVEERHKDAIIDDVRTRIEEYADLNYPNTNPGFALAQENIPERVIAFSQQALWRPIPTKLAERIIEREALVHYGAGNKRGLIGALAAIGNPLVNDYTFEFIAYRSFADCHLERGVSVESVKRMDAMLSPMVFANIDPSNSQILIEPHGPDPVLFGVRGETPDAVKTGGFMVEAEQAIERWMILRTNQSTGAHLTHFRRITSLRPYMAAKVSGTISKKARIIEGGHVIFEIADDSSSIDCAVYEPTGEFREIANLLLAGDRVVIHGSIRPRSRTHSLTLNVEGIEILDLAPNVHEANPLCIKCGKRMKSAGRQKGFKCSHCGHRERTGKKITTSERRELKEGLYLPPARAQRHLTRPLERLGKSNSEVAPVMIAEWHNP